MRKPGAREKKKKERERERREQGKKERLVWRGAKERANAAVGGDCGMAEVAGAVVIKSK